MNHSKHYWQCKIFSQFAMRAKCLNPECLQDAWDKAHIIASFINDKTKEIDNEKYSPFTVTVVPLNGISPNSDTK